MAKSDEKIILAALTPSDLRQLQRLEVFPEIDSTNDYLLNAAAPAAGAFQVAIADQQTAGRGRGGNQWQSPPGAGLYLSIAHTFSVAPKNLSALTLAIGVGVAEALSALLTTTVMLKWPNDLILNEGKLGGILTETRSGANGTVTVVVGIGINIDNSHQADEPTSKLGKVSALNQFATIAVERNALAALVTERCIATMNEFSETGFDEFRERWSELNWLADKRVRVDADGNVIEGIAFDIDDMGALLVRDQKGDQRILSGSVSVVADTGAAS
jgi:BirA family biotin operon repressor/biotin-[acetyl-CoA-carboxylase] ligase